MLLVLSLATATFLSEDLACAAAGALVAEGRLGFVVATTACFAGIFSGDLLLFLAGRVFGRRLLEWPLVKRRVAPDVLMRSSAWIDARGPAVVFASRFAPGTRLATYVVAGILDTDAKRFVGWFIVAAAVWTPLVVWLSALFGRELLEAGLAAGHGAAIRMIVTMAVLAGVFHAFRQDRVWRLFRRLYGKWQRLTRWEFWPLWVLYPPVLVHIAALLVKHRGIPVFTAANPAIPAGGFVGESKFHILRRLASASNHVARAALLPAALAPPQRLWSALRFMEHASLGFPIVVKPDRGQRGSGVLIVRTIEELSEAIGRSSTDLIVQEYVAGLEFGVFYYRHPGELRGRIFSITEKRFPVVTGDGRQTLEDLILADRRAVCLERLHRRVHRNRLHDVLRAGEDFQLVEVGSHCRGSLFLDATHLLTPELESAFDDVAKAFEGFFFGRFDVRTGSVDAFCYRRDFKILELNGVTSEATHIYDPSNRLFTAYRVLFEQWRLAFAIGAENVRRGSAPASWSSLLGLIAEWRTGARGPQFDPAKPAGVRT